MRLSLATLGAMPALVVGMLAAMPAAAQKPFPYKAYVTSKDVYVRSGPGEEYYPTEKLQPGAEVEVHRRDPGGWLAIRPLADSYGWVSGRYLKPGADGLAEVTADGVAARVGSRFSDIRDVVQVRLHRGEVVELKGTKELTGGQGAGTWYRIAPPAGEFRWIHERHVGTGGREGEKGRRGEGERERGPTAADVSPSPHVPFSSSPLLPAGSVRRVSSETFQAELDDINTELSIMLAEEPTVWSCDELKHRCEALLDQAETALERGRARTLISRMDQADDIKRRFADVRERERGPGDGGREVAAGGAGPHPALSRRERGRIDDRYDGSGRLARVTPSKMGAPRYALLDENGDVLYYVSPAPGVNLQYYVGREVGVSGQQGYIADGGATHIMAKHVTALDRELR